MILNERSEIDRYTAQGTWGGVTLDAMFLRTAKTAPDRIALIDPVNRTAFTDGEPQRLTYGEAALRVEALAARFVSLGLKPDDVVAVQLPNIIEAYLTLLAAMRAQLIACPLPPLWREHDINAALGQVAPRAIITASSSDGHAHADMMRYVAAENFSVRHVLVFGDDVPDGTLPLNDAFDADADTVSPATRGDGANHVATICFEAYGDHAPRPAPRSHNHWIAASMMHLIAAGITRNDTILNPYFPTGLTGLSGVFGPWLIAGCTLACHHPFDAAVFVAGLEDTRATYTLLPPSVLATLGAADAFAGSALSRIGCSWPAPYLARAAGHLASKAGDLEIIDLYALGEVATFAAPRGGEVQPGRIPLGKIRAPLGSQTGPILLETRIKGAMQRAGESGGPALSGALEVRGPMVPAMSVGPADGRIAGDHERTGYVTTGVNCRISGMQPPVADCLERIQDVIHVGNTTLSAAELDQVLGAHSSVADAAVFAMSDAQLGERLAVAVVAESGSRVSTEDMRTYLMARKVAAHKMPEKVVDVAEIPRDDNGKVQRDRLRRPGLSASD